MNHCPTCGKAFHHSLILANGAEAPQCLACATAPHRHAAEGDTPPPHRHHYYDARDELWKAWVAIGLLSLVAIVLIYGLWSHDAEERATAQQESQAIATFVQEIRDCDLTQPEAARTALRRVGAMQELWARSDRANEVLALRDRAAATVRAHDTLQSLGARLQALSAALHDPAPEPERLAALHEEAVAVCADARRFDGDAGGRAAAMQARVADYCLQHLHANAAAAAGEVALVRYGRAELLAAAMERQAKTNHADLSPSWFQLRDRLAGESDAVCVQVATPQFLARVPVQDLLRQDQKDGWRASSTDGLSMQLQRGVLQIDNGAPAGGAAGVVAIGYNDGWRDFVLQFDATVQRGEVRLLLRLCTSTDPARVPHLVLAAGQDGHCRVDVLGGTVRASCGGGAEQQIDATAQPRVGGIGVLLSPGSAVRFTSMSLQKLR